ncbi:MAG: 50S ribosomal protein L9 [Corynebacterium sp.]|nr:50S ribosomal protein L9 [Corynebacterium sp.]
MKLILTAEVDHLGAPGDIVEVKPGYGRNYLLPRGLAIVATKGAEKQVENLKKAREARAIHDLDHANEVKAQLEALTGVTIAVRTAEGGTLFGSISAADIVKAIRAAGGPALAPSVFDVPRGLVKNTGSYTLDANLHEDIVAKVAFEVVAE